VVDVNHQSQNQLNALLVEYIVSKILKTVKDVDQSCLKEKNHKPLCVFISVSPVQTHVRNIKRFLKVKLKVPAAGIQSLKLKSKFGTQ